MSQVIPRILIAGTQSGNGKTTLALGLIYALRRRGLKVQAIKVGPDYLDPTWLAAASGRPCYNLDGWMGGRDYAELLFRRVTKDADLAVIEGVMGLFDGAQESDLAGSSAEIAQWLRVPVVLVINAHGMSQSIAPMAAGFADFKKGVHVGGIIANQCGSERHGTILGKALTESGQPSLIGAVPRSGFPELHSRHLGLMTAEPAGNCSTDLLEKFAINAERYLDLEKTLNIAHSAPKLLPFSSYQVREKGLPDHPIRLAVARDEAFHFYYQDLFDELEKRGCHRIPFSPLRDGSLPQGIDALYLGGGYPEEFAEILSSNRSMLEAVREFARSGRPVYAECGGLIYLSRVLTTRDGKRYPLAGILPGETRILDHRQRLGYVEVSLRQDSLWGKSGTRLRGHEFHYSEWIPDLQSQGEWSAAYDMKTSHGAPDIREGLDKRNGHILASYVHLHLASQPGALDHFVRECLQDKREDHN